MCWLVDGSDGIPKMCAIIKLNWFKVKFVPNKLSFTHAHIHTNVIHRVISHRILFSVVIALANKINTLQLKVTLQ